MTPLPSGGIAPLEPEDPVSIEAYEAMIAAMDQMIADAPGSIAEAELEERLLYKEQLHPRGRGGRWIRKFGLPQQHEREQHTASSHRDIVGDMSEPHAPHVQAVSAEPSTYWHITSDPNFKIDPKRVPTEMGGAADQQSDAGLMVTKDLPYWASMLQSHPDELGVEYENSDARAYAAEIDLSKVPADEHWLVNRGNSDERWVNRPDLAQVKRVVPLRQAFAIQDKRNYALDHPGRAAINVPPGRSPHQPVSALHVQAITTAERKNTWAPGETASFEYHCTRTHDSADADLWYRSHQQVTVLQQEETDLTPYLNGAEPWNEQGYGGPLPTTPEQRMDYGMPLAYRVRFRDGHEGTAMEDELYTDPRYFDPKEGPPPLAEIRQHEPGFQPHVQAVSAPATLTPEEVARELRAGTLVAQGGRLLSPTALRARDVAALGDLPVPVGEGASVNGGGYESIRTPEGLRGYGDAIRAGVERHPELLSPQGLQSVSFISAPRWDRMRPQMVDDMILGTATNPGKAGAHLIINDVIHIDPEAIKRTLAPADGTPEGLATHEMGHVFAEAHGLPSTEPLWMREALLSYGITPADAATVSKYAASDPRETFSELYTQTFTPGHQIEDPKVREKFLKLIADMRVTVRADEKRARGRTVERADYEVAYEKQRAKHRAQNQVSPILALTPEVQAEIQRAAEENIAAGDWVAATSLLDEMRDTLNGGDGKPDDGRGGRWVRKPN